LYGKISKNAKMGNFDVPWLRNRTLYKRLTEPGNFTLFKVFESVVGQWFLSVL